MSGADRGRCYHEVMSKGLALVFAAALAGCASPASRIKRSQAVFDAFPKETQAAVREGRVEPGMTPEMVQLALGKPDRAYSRKTPDHRQEIWVYGFTQTTPGVGVVAVPAGYE